MQPQIGHIDQRLRLARGRKHADIYLGFAAQQWCSLAAEIWQFRKRELSLLQLSEKLIIALSFLKS